MASTNDPEQPWFLKSTFPVLFPFDDAVRKPIDEFHNYLQGQLKDYQPEDIIIEDPEEVETKDERMTGTSTSDSFTVVSKSTSASIRRGFAALEVEYTHSESSNSSDDGLETPKEEKIENLMLTENGDLAYRSTKNDLVDLFSELEDVISGPLLAQRLEGAWNEDPLATLKIIFNARSIHLGKSSRRTLYRCAGWLAQKHPLTLVANLQWLTRPVIEKKAEGKTEDVDDDMVVVDDEKEDDPQKYDVRNGVSHGYWKDLLNILVLAVNHKLNVMADPRDVFNTTNPGISRGKKASRRAQKSNRASGARGRGSGRGRGRGGRQAGSGRDSLAQDKNTKADKINKPKMTKEQRQAKFKEARHQTRDNRHDNAIDTFNANPFYRTLHLTIARLFAQQLEKDIKTLKGTDAKAKRTISLCGKWAPSHDHFHDRHTFIVSTIAEILYPRENLDNISSTADREEYIRYAREEYRKDTSALRRHLDIVERKITTGDFEQIKYEKVPSLAMNQYAILFIEKDLDHFEKYIDNVASGKKTISGATLLPSTLIQKIRTASDTRSYSSPDRKKTVSQMLEAKTKEIEARVADGQWKSIVQRIKDSGTLESSIAVCDVSGSMTYPQFPDKTTPMDSAIGLSLLMAEVAKPPFGGAFITFSSSPAVERVDLTKSLKEKYEAMAASDWGMNTNFISVFEDLILPMAVQNKVRQEDMVKRIFVFSDMQFDSAMTSKADSWNTSYQRINRKFKEAGYETPELVFWNLAGGRAGYAHSAGDPTAPKPVTVQDEGTCLVSGYSQGMLKVFLEGGSFEDPEEEPESVILDKNEEGEVVERQQKKAKMDPLVVVNKAIGHKAYDMLKVWD